MTKTLLVPVDGSEFAERALPVATGLATRIGADVEVVTTPWEGREQAAEHYLASLVARLDQEEIVTDVVSGETAADAILRATNELADATVCMASHGRGGFRWAMLGSVAEAVVRESPIPVVLVGRHARPVPADAGEVLLCWDGGPASLSIVRPACTWAQALDVGVHFVRVAHPLDLDPGDHHDDVLEQAVDLVRSRGVAVGRTLLHDAHFSGRIADFATTRNSAIIAMASHARTGIERVGLGSVTMGVVGCAPCPVLVARTPV
jgi:nucleotide-binding universal stress UspA family protein